jgi:UDP-GlcNAc3NAcA epimerase
MKVALIVGTRPQYIKLAPFIKASRGKLDLIIIDTGQHYDADMSSDFVKEFRLPNPHYQLNVGSASHGLQTGRMLTKLDAILSQEMPNMTVVFGDTNSTLAGALASVKLGIPVAHIEAGTRSDDLSMPEEINRRMTDSISTLLFAPTRATEKNLLREGHSAGVHMVGDIMVDTLEYSKQMASEHSRILEDNELKPLKYIFSTVHRPSNTDDKTCLKNILTAMREIDMPIIMPLHPRTEKMLKQHGLGNDIPNNAKMIDPIPHHDTIQLIRNAYCVMTDSGGVVKEAYLLRTPCITLRNTTEWPETLESCHNTLVGNDRIAMVEAVRMCRMVNPDHEDVFGTPGVSERIVSIIRGG